MNEKGWKLVLFEGRRSSGAALNCHEIEKSNVDLEESSGSIFEESKVSLGVALNYHEFKLTMSRRGVATRAMVVHRGNATGTTVSMGMVATDDDEKKNQN